MARTLPMLMSAVLLATLACASAPAHATEMISSASSQSVSAIDSLPARPQLAPEECTHVFNGTKSTQWNVASNWTPAQIPGEEAIVCLAGKTVIVPSTFPVTVGGIYGDGATITLNGKAEISGKLVDVQRVSGEGPLVIASKALAELPVNISAPVDNRGVAYLGLLDEGADSGSTVDATVVTKSLVNNGTLVIEGEPSSATAGVSLTNSDDATLISNGGTFTGTVRNAGSIVTDGEGLSIKNLEWLSGSVGGSVSANTVTAQTGAKPLTQMADSNQTSLVEVATVAASEASLELAQGVTLQAQYVNGPVTNRGVLQLAAEAPSAVSVKAAISNYGHLTARANMHVSAPLDNYGILDIGANEVFSSSLPLVTNHPSGTIAGNGGSFTAAAPLSNQGYLMARANGLVVNTLTWLSGRASGKISGRTLEIVSESSALESTGVFDYKELAEKRPVEPDVEDPDEYLPVGDKNDSENVDVEPTSPANEETPQADRAEDEAIHATIAQGATVRAEQLRVPTTNNGSVIIAAQYGSGIFAPTTNNGDLSFEDGTEWRALDADIVNNGFLNLGRSNSFRSTTDSHITNAQEGTAVINGTRSINQFKLENNGSLKVGPIPSSFTSVKMGPASSTTVVMTEKSYTPFGTSSNIHMDGSLNFEFAEGYVAEAGRALLLVNGSKSVTGTFAVPTGWGMSATSTQATVTRLKAVVQGWSLSGAPIIGETLVVEVNGWSIDGVESKFQWTRDGIDIPGAVGAQYTVSEADAGSEITVRISGVKEGFATVQFEAPSMTVLARFTEAGSVSVSGTARVGSILTAAALGSLPQADAVSYQWLRDGETISGARSGSYVLTAADRGHSISVEATLTREGYVDESVVSASTATVIQVNTAKSLPGISGTARVGQKLSASKGTYSATPTSYTYQWLRDGKAISGATKSTYTLVSKDGGRKISVKVTAKRANFTTVTQTSKATSAVVKIFTTAPTPKITGTTKVGSTLKLSVGTWKPYKPTFTYRWLRNGKSISGATKSSYKLTKADKGKKISIKVVAKRTGYQSVTKYSKSTSTVR